MSRVITFSRFFPAYHPKKGEPTHFVEQVYNSIGMRIGVTKRSGDIPEAMWDLVNDFILLDGQSKKHHTIRAGKRWKVGDKFSPRVWSGKPYASQQITIAPDIEIVKLWDFEIKDPEGNIYINGDLYAYTSSTDALNKLAENDGLTQSEMLYWFKHPKPISGQILCWNSDVEY